MAELIYDKDGRLLFTKEMKAKSTFRQKIMEIKTPKPYIT